MPKYIDAEKLIAEKAHTKFDWNDEIDVEDIVNFPAADVQEVIHEKWVFQGMRKTKYKVTFTYHCSKCFRLVTRELDEAPIADIYPYCHCGAKMDGEK